MNYRLHRLKLQITPIMVVVFGFWFLVSASSAMDVDLWQVPALPKSQVVWENRPIEINQIKAQATHLRCELSAEQILNFYKEKLAKSGWEHQADLTDTISTFAKGERFFYVGIQENGQGLPYDVYLVSSPTSLAICRSLEQYFLKDQLAGDAPGKDPSDLPRYPGSKRRLDVLAQDEGSIYIYEAEAKPKEIAQFYRENLKMSGWQEEIVFGRPFVQKIFETLKEQAIIFLHRQEDTLLINITVAPKNFPGEEKAKGKRSFILISRNLNQEFAGSEEVK